MTVATREKYPAFIYLSSNPLADTQTTVVQQIVKALFGQNFVHAIVGLFFYKMDRLSNVVNTMIADGLATQGAVASAAIVVTYFSWNVQFSSRRVKCQYYCFQCVRKYVFVYRVMLSQYKDEVYVKYMNCCHKKYDLIIFLSLWWECYECKDGLSIETGPRHAHGWFNNSTTNPHRDGSRKSSEFGLSLFLKLVSEGRWRSWGRLLWGEVGLTAGVENTVV